MQQNIYIIGAGPAGMSAAITIKKQNRACKVTILEGTKQAGKKLSMTGNGKCNFTNSNMHIGQYYSDSEAGKKWIEAFLQEDSVATVRTLVNQELGVMDTDREGYYYPYGGQATLMVEGFLRAIRRYGIEIAYDCKVSQIQPKEDGYAIVLNQAGSRVEFFASHVILATGSTAYPKTGSDGSGYMLAMRLGFKLTPWHPALTGILSAKPLPLLKEWSGVRVHANVSLHEVTQEKLLPMTDIEYGEVQLTDYGISGIPVFQLSRELSKRSGIGKTKAEIYAILDFVPELSKEALQEALKERMQRFGTYDGILNQKLLSAIIKHCQCKNEEELARAMKRFKLLVNGTKGYDNAQVCAGGIDLCELNPDTLEAVRFPNIYVVGEVMDLDGKCGGYNLHAAMLSGIKAGIAIEAKYE